MQITFKDVTKSYQGTLAVEALNLTIDSGALHFFLGPSGCGKTTTLRMLAGLESVTSGKIFFDDQDVTHLDASARGIGMVFQNYALWPHMTVRQNIEYGLKIKKMSKQKISDRLEDVLDFTRLAQYPDRLPGQLSGGQQQRVALARALAIQPRLLLLDEPLSNLDAKLRLEMRTTIADIHRRTGITTVYVTHDQKEALSMGTSISLMFAGQLIQTGSPHELYHQPHNKFVAEFIGETNIIKGKINGIDDHSISLVTALGDIRCARPDFTLRMGDSVLLTVRPEQIKVNATDQDTQNTFDAKLSGYTFLGEQEQLVLEIGDIKLRCLSLSGSVPPSHDSSKSIKTHIPPDSAIVLENTDSLGPGT